VHFNAAGFRIDFGQMGKLAEIKVGIELAIDAGQNIAIECRRYADFVVVSPDELLCGLLEVGSEKKRIAGRKNAPDFGSEFYSGGAVKVSDRAA
jgi:hypothetical protein